MDRSHSDAEAFAKRRRGRRTVAGRARGVRRTASSSAALDSRPQEQQQVQAKADPGSGGAPTTTTPASSSSGGIEWELRRTLDLLDKKRQECDALRAESRRVSARASAAGFGGDAAVKLRHTATQLTDAKRHLEATQEANAESEAQHTLAHDRTRRINAARRVVYLTRLPAQRRYARAFLTLKLHSATTEAVLEATCAAEARVMFRSMRMRNAVFVRLVYARAARRTRWALGELSRARLSAMRTRFLALYAVCEAANHRRLLRIAMRGCTSRLAVAWRLWERGSRKEGAKYQIRATMRRSIAAKKELLAEHRNRILHRATKVCIKAKTRVPFTMLREWVSRTSAIARGVQISTKSVKRLVWDGIRMKWNVWTLRTRNHRHAATISSHRAALQKAQSVILSLEDQHDFMHAQHNHQLQEIHAKHSMALWASSQAVAVGDSSNATPEIDASPPLVDSLPPLGDPPPFVAGADDEPPPPPPHFNAEDGPPFDNGDDAWYEDGPLDEWE